MKRGSSSTRSHATWQSSRRCSDARELMNSVWNCRVRWMRGYQAVDYLGIGRVLPFLDAANEILEARGVKLPLEGQATTTMQDRLEKGAQAQADIFGEHMKEAWKADHINRWLAANCFGDYYTRTGLDLRQREMITFCFLAAQGGCEPQLTAHAKGNMNLGNDKEFLLKVVSQCLPYIGYPRSLNAVTCINNAAQN